MQTVFTDGTVWRKDKLDMINQCLLSIGEAPFPEGTDPNGFQHGIDADVAKSIVEKTMVEVQTRGWFFNEDHNVDLLPDTRGFVSVGPNVLRVDFTPPRSKSSGAKYVLRNGRVYDRDKHTYKIDKKVKAYSIVYLVDYEDLPPEAYNYIAARSAVKFETATIGAPELDSFSRRTELETYIELQAAELSVLSYRLDNPYVSR